MTLVTVPQVNPNDEVTALSVNQGPNAIAAVLNGNIDDSNVSGISGSKISTGTLPASASDTSSNVETRELETTGNIVVSGLVWSALTGLNATMSSGVAYVGGKRLAIATIATRAFTASRDTYVSVDSTGTIAYQEVTNGATAPTLATGYLWVSLVVSGASTITSATPLNGSSNPRARAIRNGKTVTVSGWDIMPTGVAAQKNKTIPFGLTFVTPQSVTMVYGGDSTAGSTSFTNVGITEKGYAISVAYGVVTNQFNARLYTGDGSNWSSGTTVFFQWSATGEVA